MTALGAAAPGGPAARGLPLTIRLFGTEAGKGLRLMWARRGLLVSGIVSGGIVYLMVRFLIGGGHITRAMVALTLPALLAYEVAVKASLQGSGGIAEEVHGGTLEQSQLSPARPTLLVSGRLAALGTEQLIAAAVLGVVFGLGYRVHYTTGPGVLVPVLLTLADALGYALLMTALTLRFASIGAIVHVAGMAIMFFNGAYLPISWFPHGVQVFTRFVPTALGVQVMNTTLAGHGLGTSWADGTLPWLIAHAAVITGLGWLTYTRTLRRARREGGLSAR